MSATKLSADAVGLPRFAAAPAAGAEVFELTSHGRAREALDIGLAIGDPGFNIFVLGEDRSARMTATVAYLAAALAKRPPLHDWVYLNNFHHPAAPIPLALPAGMGRRLRDTLARLIPKLRETLAASFTADAYQARVLALRQQAEKAVAADFATLAQTAAAHGLKLVQGEDGALRLLPAAAASGAPAPALDEATEREMAAAVGRAQFEAVKARAQFAVNLQALNQGIAAEALSPAIDAVARDFAIFPGLARWLTELRVDLIEAPERFQLQPGSAPDIELPERRYAVNLFVDHGDEPHPAVVLEANPSYAHLFGWIEYRQSQGSMQTDFTLIRAGALHRANGGVLVLRAEALAANPMSWIFLKAALRDRQLRIEEPSADDRPPLAGAPRPGPIAFDLKVVLVGAPRWYASFFEGDPDFRTYFKINADIDRDTPADPRNLGLYAGLLAAMAARRGLAAEEGALATLLSIAARWAERRDRLTAQIELVEDVVAEAALLTHRGSGKSLSEAAVRAAYAERRRRNARLEETMLKHIIDGMMLIDTAGGAIGQINALTVNTAGDHQFGTPVRVTARAYAGRAGVINIERFIGLGGPIQQKGAMVLEGYLAGRFAQSRPLSFTCSITFEQVYGGVEGDSASLAELIAILSDLAQLPVRQDLAITGSVNQEGMAQAIGGAHWKIEGFYRVCAAKPGGLTGTQGVIVPEANRVNLVLSDELTAAVASGRFHLWSVGTVEDAAELLLSREVGQADAAGNYPPDSIFGRITGRLDRFDRILADRSRSVRDDRS